ncbi:MAG: hypothetical protein ACLP5H_23095 [Desulfomonilaceae bacterium]
MVPHQHDDGFACAGAPWDTPPGASEVSRSETLKEAVNGNEEILSCLDRLFWKTITLRTRVRQVGVKLSGIGTPVHQMNLFDPELPLREERDRVVDTIRHRFGFDAVRLPEEK